eukprot:14391934-Alexandrium_andersonii.AAC.1
MSTVGARAAVLCADYDHYITRWPKCSPQSAQGPSVLQSAAIRSLPCRTCKKRFRHSELYLCGSRSGLKS